jgi:hypothetical protein
VSHDHECPVGDRDPRGPVAAPRSGRFYTIVLRLGPGAGHVAWTVAYEARRGIVRAAGPDARAFLGRRWLRLTAEMQPPFAAVVRGLEPLRRPPRLE